MEIEGAVLRAALECAARPSRKDPHRWTTCIRVAQYTDETTVIEATDGQVAMRLLIEKESPQEEAFLRRETVLRIKDADRVVIDENLFVEDASLAHDFRPLDTLPNSETGEPMKVWPDFNTLFQRSKRKRAPKTIVRHTNLGKIAKSAAHLGTARAPVHLSVVTGSDQDPVIMRAKCLYGEVTYALMPCSGEEEDPPANIDGDEIGED